MTPSYSSHPKNALSEKAPEVMSNKPSSSLVRNANDIFRAEFDFDKLGSLTNDFRVTNDNDSVCCKLHPRTGFPFIWNLSRAFFGFASAT